MRLLVLAVLVSGCVASRAPLTEPVEFRASLQAGTVQAGAVQGVGGTLFNRSSRTVIHYGRGEIDRVRLLRQSEEGPYRRADVPGDSSVVVGPYWERAYHLAFAIAPGTGIRLDQPFTRIPPGSQRVMRPVRFAWPRDPGVYRVSVCSTYAPEEHGDSREVCAPAVWVTVQASPAESP